MSKRKGGKLPRPIDPCAPPLAVAHRVLALKKGGVKTEMEYHMKTFRSGPHWVRASGPNAAGDAQIDEPSERALDALVVGAPVNPGWRPERVLALVQPLADQELLTLIKTRLAVRGLMGRP